MSLFSAFFPLAHSNPLIVPLDRQEMKTRSLHGTLIISVAQLFKFIIQVISIILLARLLFADDFGLNAMIYPILGVFFVISEVGLSQILILKKDLDQEFVSSLFWINMTLGFAIALIMVAIAPVAAWFFGEPRLTMLIILTGLCLPLGAIGTHPSALLTRQMRYGVGAFISAATALLGLLATVAAAWAGWSYWSFLIGQFCSTIVGTALVWIAVGWMPSAPKVQKNAVAALRFGGNMTGANLATYLTTAGDNAIIAYVFGSHALGLYDRSYKLVVQPIGQLLAPIGTTAIPFLARLRDDPPKYQEAYLAMLYTVVFATVPGMVTCVVFAHQVIEIFLGSRWIEAAPIFEMMSVGGLVSAIYASTFWLFVSQERVGELMRVTLAASFINIAAFLIGARFGLYEVAFAGAISFICVNLPLMLYVALRTGPLRAGKVMRTLAYQYAFVGVNVLLLVLLKKNVDWTSPVLVIVALLISYVTSGCGVLLSKAQRGAFIKIVALLPSLTKR